MKPVFLITGLPRSRTAWLANLFCTGSVLCLHEPIAYTKTGLPGVFALVEQLDAQRVGISDSSIPLFWSTYRRLWPEAPVVVIERPIEEALASLAEHTGKRVAALAPLLREVAQGLEAIKRQSPALVVSFSDLDSCDSIKRIWTYCVPDVEFNLERTAVLQRFNVQQPFIPWLGSQD